ncbi:phosphorylase superfamily protein [Xylariaceae sp. FL0255]|nr:phosphorylase superfamily protein [Xylariaceae sp. FL0255]
MAAEPVPSLPREEYTVGWICAIPIETAAARNMLDVRHTQLQSQPIADENNYTLGSLHDHHIVIASLEEYGTVKATAAVTTMRSTFPRLRFVLMVGVGGGIPSAKHDIRLGDIVVSYPISQQPGVIQYDRGKAEEGGFRRVGTLNKPPRLLLTALSTLRSFIDLPKQVSDILTHAFPTGENKWLYPGVDKDVLFEAEFSHTKEKFTCDECKTVPSITVDRKHRETTDPQVHYGTIACGNSVIKTAKFRDALRNREDQADLLCFEMESAGLMDIFPSLAIRGICDYSDPQKNKHWQPYAAAVAAAFAKRLLFEVSKLEPIQAANSSAGVQHSSQGSPRTSGSESGMINHFNGTVNAKNSFQGSNLNGGQYTFS